MLTLALETHSAAAVDWAEIATDEPAEFGEALGNTSRMGPAGYFDWALGNWSDWARVDNDSAEVVIGLNSGRANSYSGLIDLVNAAGVQIVDSISICGNVQAVVADVPLEVFPSFMEAVEARGLSRYIEPNVKFNADLVPNDTDWDLQWGPRKIEADRAWDTTMGDRSVLVAVVDTGIDWDHPDLAANYVPLGYDWVNKDDDPMDDSGHGTHVAGIIAAAINNKKGIAGLAQVRIMAEKGISEAGSGTTEDLVKAIIHAVDRGADIISCSWGSIFDSELMHEAMRYAYERGVLIVASAGNEGRNWKSYPAAYDEVVAVTATDDHDSSPGWTSFGEWVELAAPGWEIYSTIWDDYYATASGTSMSAPHVSGVAALIWSQFPYMTRDQVRAQLRMTADDLGLRGFDVYYGFGRINARKAVEQAPDEHDLFLLGLNSPLHLNPGSQAVVNATVLNMGRSDEVNVTVQLLLNGSVFGSNTIDFVASGASIVVGYPWKPEMAGVYNVTSYILPADGETVVSNNALSAKTSVRFAIVIRVPQMYARIQDAIDAAFEGDTVYVAAGKYFETLWINKENLTLAGENRENTIIDGVRRTDVISVVFSKHVKIRGFTILRSAWWGSGGIVAVSSEDVEISDVTVKDSDYGILLLYSTNTTLLSNIVSQNYYGVIISVSINVTMKNNDISSSRESNFTLEGSSLANFLLDADTTNFVDGKPIVFWINQHDKEVPSGVGYVALVNSSNIIVEDLDLDGVLLAYSNNCTIRNVSVSTSVYSVYLMYSSGNTIADSVLSEYDRGIFLWGSDDNYIYGNILLESVLRMMDPWGIALSHSNDNAIVGNELLTTSINFAGIALSHASRNRIRGNNVVSKAATKMGIGIRLVMFSDDNTIVENTFTNYGCGISIGALNQYGHVDQNYGNRIYHNNFIKNKRQFLSLNSVNSWDDGYIFGGNYWSNYADVDSYSGRYQNESGIDGVWDHPYIIDSSNRDQYPLVNPWPIIPATVDIDPDTLNLRSHSQWTTCYIELPTRFDLNRIVVSSIRLADAFSVDPDAPTEVGDHDLDGIPDLMVKFSRKEFASYVYNVLGFRYGSMTLKVTGQLSDGSILEGSDTIFINYAGDVNNDGTINILDAAAVSAHWYPGPPVGPLSYGGTSDLNNDGTINIIDAGIINSNWGQKVP